MLGDMDHIPQFVGQDDKTIARFELVKEHREVNSKKEAGLIKIDVWRVI